MTLPNRINGRDHPVRNRRRREPLHSTEYATTPRRRETHAHRSRSRTASPGGHMISTAAAACPGRTSVGTPTRLRRPHGEPSLRDRPAGGSGDTTTTAESGLISGEGEVWLIHPFVCRSGGCHGTAARRPAPSAAGGRGDGDATCTRLRPARTVSGASSRASCSPRWRPPPPTRTR